MKKVLAAALLCAVSSFATWDYFPIKPAGKGELKLGVNYNIDPSATDIPFQARFSVIEGLEVAAFSGYDITGEALDQPTVGLRYWMPMGLGIFLDVAIPVDDGQVLGFYVGPQFSTSLTSELTLGAELGIDIGLQDSDTKVTPEKKLKFGVEFDYSLGGIIPFVALDGDLGIIESEAEVAGKTVKGGKSDLDMGATVGVICEINEMITADAYAAFGGLLSDGDIGISIGADISINF